MKTKLFLIGLISIVLCIVLTGCGAQKVEEVPEDEKEVVVTTVDENEPEEETEVAEVTGTETTEPEAPEVDLSSFELYSDDTKIVFQSDNTYMVFTYSGEEITGYQAYTYFATEELAKLALEEYNKEPDADVKNVYVDGTRLVFEYNESVYEDLTVSTLKLAYAFLSEVKKEN